MEGVEGYSWRIINNNKNSASAFPPKNAKMRRDLARSNSANGASDTTMDIPDNRVNAINNASNNATNNASDNAIDDDAMANSIGSCRNDFGKDYTNIGLNATKIKKVRFP